MLSSTPENDNPDQDAENDEPDQSRTPLTGEVIRSPERLPFQVSDDTETADFVGEIAVEHVAGAEIGAGVDDRMFWNGELESDSTTIRVPPRVLAPGDNTVTVANPDTEQTTSVSPVTKTVPAAYQLDITPAEEPTANTEAVIDALGEEAEQYLQQHRPSETPRIVSNYTPPDIFGYNKERVDFGALEWLHDNDFENLAENGNPGMKTFINNLYSDEPNEAVQNAMDKPTAWVYPNGKPREEYGEFDKEKYLSAKSAQEALDWYDPLFFSWLDSTDRQWISNKDPEMAAMRQEALDRHPNTEAHVWGFDLPKKSSGVTHGNGLTWDYNTEELHVMETIASPLTKGRENAGFHSKVENSNYLKQGHDAEQTYWHPLQFQGHDQEIEGNAMDSERAKGYTAAMFKHVASSSLDNPGDTWGEVSVALSTNYLADIVQNLRTCESNQVFNEIKRQSQIYTKFWNEVSNQENNDANYVILGDLENPEVYKTENQNTVNAVKYGSRKEDIVQSRLKSEAEYNLEQVATAELDPPNPATV